VRIWALLLDNSIGPWNQMYQNGVLKTWCSQPNSGIEATMYQGKKPGNVTLRTVLNRVLVSRYFQKNWRFFQVKLRSNQVQCTEVGNTIVVNIAETWPNITLKSLAAIRYIQNNHNFDFLIRANASCYVNVSMLKAHLESLSGTFIYAGPKNSNKDFISGWGIVLNRKAIENLLNREELKFLELFDDEAIGQILKSSGIECQAIPYREISSLQELESISRAELASFPFIRVKSSHKGKRIDDVLMRRVHELVGE